MATFTSVNYSNPIFPLVIPGSQLSLTILPTLEYQVTLLAQALEAHDHTSGKGLPITSITGNLGLTGNLHVTGTALLDSTLTMSAGKIITIASATGGAGLNLPHGAAPSGPVNGDVWTTTVGMFCRINGVTKSVNLT